MARAGGSKRTRIAVNFVAGGLVGGLVAHLLLSSDVDLSGVDLAALALALLLAGSGVFTLTMGSDARLYERLAVDAEPGEEPDGEQLRFIRGLGLINLLAGITLAVPPLTIAFGAPEGARLPVFAALVAVVLAESWANFRLYLRGDELIRTVVMRSGATCFWLLQGIFFLWAAAERLALVGPVDSWTLLVILMAVYILVSSIVSIRSGLANA